MSVVIEDWGGALTILFLDFLSGPGLQGTSLFADGSADFDPRSDTPVAVGYTPVNLDELYYVARASPVECHLRNSVGEVTGSVDGVVRTQIPDSRYVDDGAIVYSSAEPYQYVLVGTDNGTYELDIGHSDDAGETMLTIVRVPIEKGAIHEYQVDWLALS